MSTPQDCYDEAVLEYNDAERKGDQYILKLCKAMEATIATQRACSKDANPIHGTKFADTKSIIGDAIAKAADSVRLFAVAHKYGDAACDGGPIVTGGGGGK